MRSKPDNLESSIIVSVYTDHVALGLIFESLKQQTSTSFEIIISEDGEYDEIKKCVDTFNSDINVQHLTQKDSGFRKNIALNRAINASSTNHLIFIDGDCVLHPDFISAHQIYMKSGYACTGRRLELGENFSNGLRTRKADLKKITNRFSYFRNMLTLQRGKAKNIESGIYSKILFRLTRNRPINLLGCNFSCNKQDLIKINGFNEDYLAAGIGEDSDIDWRLKALGVEIKNVKFSAIQYHLFHPRQYTASEKNKIIYDTTKEKNQYVCKNGIDKKN